MERTIFGIQFRQLEEPESYVLSEDIRRYLLLAWSIYNDREVLVDKIRSVIQNHFTRFTIFFCNIF